MKIVTLRHVQQLTSVIWTAKEDVPLPLSPNLLMIQKYQQDVQGRRSPVMTKLNVSSVKAHIQVLCMHSALKMLDPKYLILCRNLTTSNGKWTMPMSYLRVILYQETMCTTNNAWPSNGNSTKRSVTKVCLKVPQPQLIALWKMWKTLSSTLSTENRSLFCRWRLGGM